MDFYNALAANQVDRAHAIVRAYEDPYFDVAVSVGWHLALKETMHFLNLMPRHERAPLPCLSNEHSAKLRACVEKLGWLERDPAHAAII
jgi:dihydrodipicolinate synthase/N-acetylneuraminate lyase